MSVNFFCLRDGNSEIVLLIALGKFEVSSSEIKVRSILMTLNERVSVSPPKVSFSIVKLESS